MLCRLRPDQPMADGVDSVLPRIHIRAYDDGVVISIGVSCACATRRTLASCPEGSRKARSGRNRGHYGVEADYLRKGEGHAGTSKRGWTVGSGCEGMFVLDTG